MERGRKPHIAFFGRRNNGKSTIINSITHQDIAIVSSIPGTTTDPVKKSMEIPGLGAAVLIDTAGIDDHGALGKKRIDKSIKLLDQIDLAVLIVVNNEFGESELQLINKFKLKALPFIVIHNKRDLKPAKTSTKEEYLKSGALFFIEYAIGEDTNNLNLAIRDSIPARISDHPGLLGGLIQANDVVMLIIPIDEGAPQGRLILPQVQTIRDILDNNAVSIMMKDSEVENFLNSTAVRPKLAITDSQLFDKIGKLIPEDIMLTSFSILLARFRGNFDLYKKGTPVIDKLKDGDNILILESCTHHAACDDIGRVKIPSLLKKHSGSSLHFDVVAGFDNIPRPLHNYALVIQCGGCMITRQQLHKRLQAAVDANIPVTNYGMAIAWVNGIYNRAMEPFSVFA